MGDRLTFPRPRIPAVLPHPNDLLVTLTKDDSLDSFSITSPLTPETIPNSEDARAALHAIQRLRHTFSSPFGTPDSVLDRPTWLRMILENLAGIHEGFRNAQLISPDTDLPKSFRDLQPEELNTVARIFEVTSWLQDFCEAADDEHDPDHISPFRTICIRCVESADLPPPPANITDIMLSNALEVRALRETLRNEAIRDAVKDIDAWREKQTEAMITDLVEFLTKPDCTADSLARELGNMDPRIAAWVDSIRGPLREAAISMVTQEAVEDCIIPHSQEFLESAWMKRQTEIEQEIRKRSSEHEAELRHSAELYAAKVEQDLRTSTENTIAALKAELDEKLANEIAQLKNHAKASLQAAKEEADSHSLTLAIRTTKAPKPSPLNITKPKKRKGKKKATNVLDLTTPSPDPPSDMETDTDSTPTTPICRSSAPSPANLPIGPSLVNPPFSTAPEEVPVATADPETIPSWVRTPSPEDRTPHAPTFPQPHAPSTIPPDGLAAIMAAINGLKTQMMSEIGKVNARIDDSIAPTDIPTYMAGMESDLSRFDQPLYIDPAHDLVMEEHEAANLDRFNTMLRDQSFFRTTLLRLIAEKRVSVDMENDHYVDQWNEMCAGLCKSLHWDPTNLPTSADDTIVNSWGRISTKINEEEFVMTTSFIYERITGTKPDTSSPEGRTRLATFTTTYNDFCATYNFPAHEGFPESQDAFFKHLLATGKQAPINPPPAAHPHALPPKTVRFTSAPPIATLSAPTSDDEFPALRAPSQEPISYASAAGAFIPVSRRRRAKPTQPPSPNPAPPKPGSKAPPPGPKPIRPTKPTPPAKPPLPDALKTTKYTIILDHTAPTAKALYSLDASNLTRGLQTHLETVKAPLVLLAGSWSSAPFYKNFILTFSGIVNFTDITKYNSILFAPFGANCRAAPTAGYQSILISGVRLQKDARGKLASPKMLYDELCRNPVFVGRLPLAAPRWLFNPDKLLESEKEASSITFSFHDPTGEGLELMRRSRVGMFGKLVSIRSWEARPLLSQCTRCLRLGHSVERCRRHKDLVVCSKCGGAHQDALHHFNCPHANKHKGRGCDCPPSCFLCIAQGHPKAAQGHTSTSVSCPLRKHFRTPTPVSEPDTRQRSTTIPPSPGANGPMTVLSSAEIKQFSADGMAVDDITRLLVPPEVAALASASTPTRTGNNA